MAKLFEQEDVLAMISVIDKTTAIVHELMRLAKRHSDDNEIVATFTKCITDVREGLTPAFNMINDSIEDKEDTTKH